MPTGERVSAAWGQIPGTKLDRALRVAGNTLDAVRVSLDRAKAYRERVTRQAAEDVERLESELVAAQAAYDKALKEKRENEPGATFIPGLIRNKGRPPGVTQKEWVEMRKSGKHLEYLGS